jgi:L-asparaginase/Glu-tRNA(Gln) amidotransferase subunit D
MPNNEEWFDAIESAIEADKVVIDLSQCTVGTVSAAYESGSTLAQLGVINGGDITYPAAQTKIMYLLGKNYDSTQIKKLFQTDIRGELTIGNL